METTEIVAAYEKCVYCGKLDMPPKVYFLDGYEFEDDSMVCNGIPYMQVDPFRAEIYDDSTEVMMCDGEFASRKDDI